MPRRCGLPPHLPPFVTVESRTSALGCPRRLCSPPSSWWSSVPRRWVAHTATSCRTRLPSSMWGFVPGCWAAHVIAGCPTSVFPSSSLGFVPCRSPFRLVVGHSVSLGPRVVGRSVSLGLRVAFAGPGVALHAGWLMGNEEQERATTKVVACFHDAPCGPPTSWVPPGRHHSVSWRKCGSLVSLPRPRRRCRT